MGFKALVPVVLVVTLFAACSRMPVYPAPPESGDVIAVPLSTLSDHKPVFYTFRTAGGKGVNFFVIREGSEVQSYIDACAKCFPRKRGYRAEDGRIVCRECDVGYQYGDLKHGIGSCYPISLAGAVDGAAYVIRKEDLNRCSRYF